jgi:hypothetical protein
LFLVGSFLPYYRVDLGSGETISLVSQMMDAPTDEGVGPVVGGGLLLLATTAFVVVLAALGLVGRSRAFTGPALIGAAVTWSLTWAGALIRSASSFGFDVGYYVIWVGVGIVIVGSVIVFTSSMKSQGPTTTA